MKPFNYLFYGIFWILLIFITGFQTLLVEGQSTDKIFFLLFAFGQSTLEISLYILGGLFVAYLFPRSIYLCYIGLIFTFFLTHIGDFAIHKIVGLSFWEGMGIVLNETKSNFLEMLRASSIPFPLWIVFFSSLLLLPLIGVGLYLITEKWVYKQPIKFKRETLYVCFLTVPFALMIWDLSLTRFIPGDTYTQFVEALPWRATFFEPKKLIITNLHSLKKPRPEELVLKELEKTSWSLPTKPNIYLFIIESLREDFISPEIAPHLHQLKKENIAFDLSLSNSNASHLSWYSLFYADYPLNWAERHKNWKSGSIALQVLKKMGYKLHVYSSSALSYYGMDRFLFGENSSLIDSYHPLFHGPALQAHEADAKTVEIFQEEFEKNKKDGNVYIFFWDSTHFAYSFPKEKPYPFAPIAEGLDYFLPSHSYEALSQLKNSYKNALFYVDQLFGQVQETLLSNNLWKDAIVVVTGDHGEEFYEHGRLFHASGLTKEQTNVPIYYKFQTLDKDDLKKAHLITSQMEIFPSIIDYLAPNRGLSAFFEGDSLFNPDKTPFVLASRYFGSSAPYEFFIHDGKKKLIGRFRNKKDIFATKEFEVIGVKDLQEKTICPNCKEEFIHKEFDAAITKLFAP